VVKLHERLAWTDWLGLVWVTLLLGLGMAGLQVVARAALIFARDPIDVMVPTSEVGAVGAPDRLPPGMRFETGGWIEAEIAEPTLWQATLYALTTLPTTLVLAGMLLILLRVVKDAWDRNPFSTTTLRRLRLLGATLLLGGFIAEAVEAAATVALDQPIQFDSFGSYLILSWWFFAGLASLAIAEVINRGFEMRAELDTVV
jgi:hypothetical protein